MPKRKRDVLTDVQIRQVKPREKPYKLADGRGLYLYVKPNGTRLWRMDIKVSDRWVTLSFGEYPLISLKEARDKRDDTLKLKLEGRDPVQVKKAKEAAQEADLATFEVVAREWQAMAAKAWTPDYATGILRRLEKWVFPYVGGRPMGKLTSPEILSVCRRVEAKSAYTAHRVLQLFGKVFRFAVAKGLVEVNPALGLSDALIPYQEEHRATLTDPKAIGILLRAMDGYTGDILTRAALRLTPYLILRPGELRSLEWAMIHFDCPRTPFVPLSSA